MAKRGGQIKTLTYEQIESRFNVTIQTIHNELDLILIEGTLDRDKIARLSAERSTLKRALSIIKSLTEEEQDDREE